MYKPFPKLIKELINVESFQHISIFFFQMENPWNIQSIYDLQYFNCPSCIFKNTSKQEIVNHAYDFHPESIENLMNIDDNSLMDILLPWNIDVKKEIKTEGEYIENPVEFEYPMNIECMPDIKTENNYDEQIEDMYMIKQEEIGYIDKIRWKVYKCEICDKHFDRLWNLKMHNKQIHGEQKDYKCEECGKSFSTNQTLKTHMKAIHEGRKEYKCEACGKIFSHLNNLKRHTKNIHEGIKDHKCDICGKEFGNKDQLKSHFEAIHDEQKAFKCENCGKRFGKLSRLNSHMKIVHAGIREHKCELCGKEFGKKESLKACVTSWTKIFSRLLGLKI